MAEVAKHVSKVVVYTSAGLFLTGKMTLEQPGRDSNGSPLLSIDSQTRSAFAQTAPRADQ